VGLCTCEITTRDLKEETNMTATASTERRELAHRTNDGIEVTLYWSQATNAVTIAVLDSHSDAGMEFDVDANAALDAFRHPYAYAAATDAHNLAASSAGTNGLPVGADR
jgi:hypothetical protein